MPYLATIAAFGFPDFRPPTLLPIYRRMGCTACQFYRCATNPPVPAEARRIVREAGMSFDSIHGLFGAEHDPSSPDEPVRRRAVRTYEGEGRLARELDAAMVVVHPAPPAGEGEVTPASRARRVDPLRRSMAELARAGEALGVTYLIENLPPTYHAGGNPREIAELLRELDHPRVRMCFDAGHAHMVGAAAAALRDCADVVAYLHVHDNDTTADTHQIPGRGSLAWADFSRVAQGLSDELPAMLELFESEATLEGEIQAGLPRKLARWLGIRPAAGASA